MDMNTTNDDLTNADLFDDTPFAMSATPTDEPDEPAEPTESTAVVVQKPSKGKKSKSEVIPSDPLYASAHNIENLKADAARTEAKKLIAGTEFDLFKLGGVLAVVHTKEFWAEYGFQDFRTYVEQEHGLNYRKAMYLISIYYGIIEHQLTWAEVEGVGWTKLKILLNPTASSVITAENIKVWLEKAKGMTVLQLEAAIAGLLKGPDENAVEQDAGKTITTLTFKLHEDQKLTIRAALEKAKEVAGTQVDTVALEMMALEFLNKPMVSSSPDANDPLSEGSSTAALSLTDQMQTAGWEGVLKVFEKLWPSIELSVEVPGL